MWIEAIGKVKETQPGKFLRGCTSATVLSLVGTLAVGVWSTPAQAGLDLGLDVGVDIGNGGIDVDVDIGNNGVDVDIGRDGVDVDVDVGLDDTGTRRNPPDTFVDENGVVRKVRTKGGANQMMACAKDGNETAYNGFVVRDRDGKVIGWVHEATVSPSGKVLSVRLQSSSKSCYKLSGGGFRIAGDEVWANVDAVTFR